MEDIAPAGVGTETEVAGKPVTEAVPGGGGVTGNRARAVTPLMPGWWGALPDFLLSGYIFRIWLEPWRFPAKEISGVLLFLGLDLLIAVSLILLGARLVKRDAPRIAWYSLFILMFFGPGLYGAGLIPFAGFLLLLGTRLFGVYKAGGTGAQQDHSWVVADILVPAFLLFASCFILLGAFEVKRTGSSLSDRDVAAGVMIYFWLRGLAGLCAVYADGVKAKRHVSGEKFYFTGNWR